MIDRIISTPISEQKKSILLLGPRQVGKSTLIHSLNLDLQIDLSNESEFLTHSSMPDELEKMIHSRKANIILIDEVQRLPRILNTVQYLVDKNKKLKFYLTGSSARKLKRGGANLLPGRVLNYKLGPLIAKELSYNANTNTILSYGSLPEIYLTQKPVDAEKLISSYAANYLKEEIKAEALTRNLEAFARFLNELVLFASQFIDFSKLSKKSKISRHSIPRYFEILEDTLIGYRLYPFQELVETCDLIRHPKFYFFDNGVYNSMLKNYIASADRIGVLVEQMIYGQLLHSAWAADLDITISSFRTRKGVEVDFIVNLNSQVYAIEVKTSDRIISDDTNGLEYFRSLYPKVKETFIFHLGEREEKIGKVWSLAWQKGLMEMGL